MFKFSIYPGSGYSFEEQMEISLKTGINNIEICDECCGRNICDISEYFFRRHNAKNKVYIPALNMVQDIEKKGTDYIKDVIRKCGLLRIEYIVIGNISDYANMDDCYFNTITKYSRLYNVKVCMENKYGYFFNEIRNLNCFFRDYPDFYMVFNPLEFVKSDTHPFLNVFYQAGFKNRIAFLRINDGIFYDHSIRLPGEGNAEIRELVSALHTRNYREYLSLPFYNKKDDYTYKDMYSTLEKLLTSF